MYVYIRICICIYVKGFLRCWANTLGRPSRIFLYYYTQRITRDRDDDDDVEDRARGLSAFISSADSFRHCIHMGLQLYVMCVGVCVCVEEAVCAERFASLRAVFGARALFECLPRELGMRARSRNCQVEMYIWAASRPPLWGPLAGRRKYICLMCVALVLLAMIRLWFRSSDDNLSSEWMSESQTLVRSW